MHPVTDHVLDNLVHELRSTIDDSDTLTDADRDRLDALTRRIEGHADEEHEGIVAHIGDAVGRFETDHPSLVQTLNRIAQTLNAAGI